MMMDPYTYESYESYEYPPPRYFMVFLSLLFFLLSSIYDFIPRPFLFFFCVWQSCVINSWAFINHSSSYLSLFFVVISSHPPPSLSPSSCADLRSTAISWKDFDRVLEFTARWSHLLCKVFFISHNSATLLIPPRSEPHAWPKLKLSPCHSLSLVENLSKNLSIFQNVLTPTGSFETIGKVVKLLIFSLSHVSFSLPFLYQKLQLAETSQCNEYELKL